MLSKRTKYALNALVELARVGDDELLTSAVVAERAGVPRKFLEAILVDLRHAGFVRSQKGRYGGHALRMKASEIAVADVIRLFDGAIGLVPCVTRNYYQPCDECPNEATCGVRSVFMEVREATVKMLKKASVQDILRREAKLQR
jgi:Rrf2 family protein